MAPNKPTGRSGYTQAKVGEDGSVAGGFVAVEFPSRKEDIELWIAQRFVAGSNGHIAQIVQNEQDDFDFTFVLQDGKKQNVDLVEFILHSGKGSPYAREAGWISHAEVADAMMAQILKKSDHYGKPGATPLVLMVYRTHYNFLPSQQALALVKHRLRKEKIVFAAVFFVSPRSADEVHPYILFPIPPEYDPLQGIDPQALGEGRYLLLDPSKAQVVTGKMDEDSESSNSSPA